ncbi:single-strand DNA-binding protein (plasmid) [Spiroplasma corruscae]|uniref:Single-stranded DNA-binding protein n=1 Tax=Spiroplasma corruscae TaxID=216934 RepID=A0A222ERL6_9MOLU|nr:single-stranded DNA-binding protein [Spiroplasma corruscae]ASP28793.1 single-strand DNA-binding protein [Spiroplasma corruscae]
MNKAILLGRITKDPELRKTKNEKEFIGFTLAINEFSKNEKFTQFISCYAWEKTAENMVKYVKKGDMLLVEGSINSKFEKIDDKQIQQTFVSVSKITYLSNSKNENDVKPMHTENEVEVDLWDE